MVSAFYILVTEETMQDIVHLQQLQLSSEDKAFSYVAVQTHTLTESLEELRCHKHNNNSICHLLSAFYMACNLIGLFHLISTAIRKQILKLLAQSENEETE